MLTTVEFWAGFTFALIGSLIIAIIIKAINELRWIDKQIDEKNIKTAKDKELRELLGYASDVWKAQSETLNKIEERIISLESKLNLRYKQEDFTLPKHVKIKKRSK